MRVSWLFLRVILKMVLVLELGAIHSGYGYQNFVIATFRSANGSLANQPLQRSAPVPFSPSAMRWAMRL